MAALGNLQETYDLIKAKPARIEPDVRRTLCAYRTYVPGAHRLRRPARGDHRLVIPCLTLRENTERPVTVWEGTNTLVGIDPQAIRTAAAQALDGGGKTGRSPEFWDGKAAERIMGELAKRTV